MRPYRAPEVELAPTVLENSILVDSGWDQYHEGGGGRYGDGDYNENDYPY